MLERVRQPCHPESMRTAKPAAKKSKPRRVPEPDVNVLAHYLIERATAEPKPARAPQPPTPSDISRVMAELGRRGGKVGGKQRAANMTEEQRSNASAAAARARWAKRETA